MLAHRSLRVALVTGVAVASAVAAGVFAGTGCQVALKADADSVRCDLPEGAPCGGSTSLVCQTGFCRPCDDRFDKDGDGYKTCGPKALIDCNDDPATGKGIHPGALELCNGVDDNCNGLVDEEPNECTAKDEECWRDRLVCVPKGDCRLHGCTNGGCNPETGKCDQADCVVLGKCPGVDEECDAKSRSCVKLVGLGDPCDGKVKCRPGGGDCISLKDLGITLPSAGAICSIGCCSSDDCPEGAVCQYSKPGAAICVRARDLGLAPGKKSANSECATAQECRSGACTENRCLDGCCGAVTCGTAGMCSFREKEGQFFCGRQVGSGAYLSSCSSGSACKSGVCLRTSAFGNYCSKRCCSSADCDPLDSCQQVSTTAGTFISACAPAPLGFFESTGSKLGGEACSKNTDCRSARCEDKRCVDNCCHDTDCAMGVSCRPKRELRGTPLRCVAREG